MSVPEWLDSTEIGAHSRFGKLMQANTVTENGGDPADQSALDLIVLLTSNPRSSVVPLGGRRRALPHHRRQRPADHRHGRTAAARNGSTRPRARRGPRQQRRDGHADLRSRPVAHLRGQRDFVVFALPFSTLRDVELTLSGLSPTKQTVIETMGMGTNAKVHLELTHKTWPALGFSGAAYGEWNRLACGWDDCVPLGPDAAPALYVALPRRPRRAHEAHRRRPRPDAARRCRLGARRNRQRLPGHDGRFHRALIRGPLGARPVGQRRVLLLSRRPGHELRARSRRRPKARTCSPASTPPAKISASSTALSKPARRPRRRCCIGCAETAGGAVLEAPAVSLRFGPQKRATRSVDLRPRMTAVEVVVDEAHRLHERVHGRRPDEAPAASLEILRERRRLGCHARAARGVRGRTCRAAAWARSSRCSRRASPVPGRARAHAARC